MEKMNYRIDHLAFRTLDRINCVKFFQEVMGYQIQADFIIYFNDAKTEMASCTALEPINKAQNMPLSFTLGISDNSSQYVSPPEIFISEGSPGSIVHNWATLKGGAGLHHIALQIPEDTTVEKEMKKWLDKGWTENFTSDVIYCESLSQIFTVPNKLTGVVFELIKKEKYGFCKDSVKALMLASKGD